jgi:pimeloyl-ACP methyl ester carboxylesterase
VRRRTALATAATLAAGAGAGAVVVARRRAAQRGVDNPLAEPAPAPPAPLQGRVRTVTTEDGVALHVEEHGPQDAAAVFVLAHGYTQSSRLYDGTVRDLLAAHPELGVVVYDHRGHGRSGRTTQEKATIEQLGRDLARVLDEVAGERPVILAGHSMGGMTLLALAEQFPELFGDRVIGVALIGTSSGGLDDVPWGLPRPVVPLFKKLLPVANEKAYRDELAGKRRQQIAWFEAFVNFTKGADPADVKAVLDVQKECTAETMHFFLATFSDHDRAAALKALGDVPSVVLVGEHDRLCPVEHSRTLAAALPNSELVVFPGVGHMVHLQRRPEVGRHLAELVDRALAGRAADRVAS